MALPATSTSTTTVIQPTLKYSSLRIREQSDLAHRHVLKLSHTLTYSTAPRSALFDFAQQLFQINRLALAYLLFACNSAALQTLLVTRVFAMASASALSKFAWSVWNSKAARRLRKKLEFEFFVLILGCGNGFCLMIFWPGWMLVGFAYFIYLMWSRAG